MSTLTAIDKMKLEKLFDMKSGYVLDFSNPSFESFIHDSVGVWIYDDRYDYGSGSKANRLRGFWEIGSDYQVGKLTEALLERWRTELLLSERSATRGQEALYEECKRIVERLLSGPESVEIDVLDVELDDTNFDLLVQNMRDSIEKNKPETVVDRLHTYVIKFVRTLCRRHDLSYGRDSALHSMFGQYVKWLKSSGVVESEMAIRILKNSISLLDAFNGVRNDQSLAHDNPILGYDESMLIFSSVVATVRFVLSIESRIAPSDPSEFEEDLPF